MSKDTPRTRFEREMNKNWNSSEETFKKYQEMAKQMKKMCEFGILINQGNEIETPFGLEPSYIMNTEFLTKRKEHYKIQGEIEEYDQRHGIDSKKDYGEMDRDQYLIGITLNDFLKLAPVDCEKCINLVMKTRHQENGIDGMIDHLKKDHGEYYERQEQLNKDMGIWIHIIQSYFMIEGKHKEWRSKI